jgi:hypothetical protein
VVQDRGAVVTPSQGVEVVVVTQRSVRGVDRGQQVAPDQVRGVAAHGTVGAVFCNDLVADADVMSLRPTADPHRALAERDVGVHHGGRSLKA